MNSSRIRLGIDAVGIRGGGGAGIIGELVREFGLLLKDGAVIVYVLPELREAFSEWECAANVEIIPVDASRNVFSRYLWSEIRLPNRVRSDNITCLLSFANVGSRSVDVPQTVYLQQMLPFAREEFDSSIGGKVRALALRLAILRGQTTASRVIVQTQSMGRAVATAFPAIQKKLRVVPGGVSEKFLSAGERNDSLRESLMPEQRGIFFFPAAAYAHKNHRVLLQAMKQLRTRGVACWLALTLTPPSGTEVPALRAMFDMVRELGIDESVLWLGDLSPVDVRFVMQHAAAVVFPSVTESFGLPLLEARALGCPIIAADRPYAREVSGHEQSVFVRPDAPNEWANAMARQLVNWRPNQIPRSVRPEVYAEFSYSRIASMVLGVCLEAMAREAHTYVPAGMMSVSAESASVEQHFDELATEWDGRYVKSALFSARIERFVGAVGRDLQRGDLLDFGCGTGVLCRAFSSRGFVVTGVDTSRRMLERAVLLTPADKEINFVGCAGEPGELLPFADCSFDAIVSSSVLEYLVEPASTIMELFRVCRIGGILVATVPDPKSILRRIEAVETKVVSAVRPWVGGQLRIRSDYLRLSRNRFRLSDWVALFERTGWKEVSVESDGGPLALLRARRD